MVAAGCNGHTHSAPSTEDAGINCAIAEHASDHMVDDILAVLYKFLFGKSQNGLL
jgi:hypothetical protein